MFVLKKAERLLCWWEWDVREGFMVEEVVRLGYVLLKGKGREKEE